MIHDEKTKAAKKPALAALGAVVAVLICCLLVPVLIGAAWLLALGTLVELALVAAAAAFGVIAVRRRRSDRNCDSCKC